MKMSTVWVSSFVLGMVVGGQAGPIHNLYTDHRAMQVDDIVTVIISEEAKAGSESGTNTSKSNEMGLSVARGSGPLKVIPAMGASGGSNVGFDGRAGTSRQGSLDARISARVENVMDNGNLIISGSKVVEINNEKEIIKISGIVRPQDIQANNIVYSHSIADAQILYSGKGAVEQGHRPGLVARCLNWLF
jgi:flagellar L-ring protein precursor FlgH